MNRTRKARFRVRSSKEIYRDRYLKVVRRDGSLPTRVEATFTVIEHPGACAIVPIFENGDLLLLRQFRVAPEEELIEIPAGTREEGETPLETARREVIEETGYRARKLTRLGTFYMAPGFCNEVMHLFAARGLSPARTNLDAEEVIRPLRVSRREAMRMVRTGRIRDAKTLVGLLLTDRTI